MPMSEKFTPWTTRDLHMMASSILISHRNTPEGKGGNCVEAARQFSHKYKEIKKIEAIMSKGSEYLEMIREGPELLTHYEVHPLLLIRTDYEAHLKALVMELEPLGEKFSSFLGERGEEEEIVIDAPSELSGHGWPTPRG